MNHLVEAGRHRRSAREHLVRRGYADVAEDAIANVLVTLAEQLNHPAFAPPVSHKAYIIFYSLVEARAIRERERMAGATSGGVGGTRSPIAVPLDAAEGVSAASLTESDFLDAAQGDPERPLQEGIEECARLAWYSAVALAIAEFAPGDREVLEAEVSRTEPADTARRKRVERARRRARHILSRYGIRRAAPPPDFVALAPPAPSRR